MGCCEGIERPSTRASEKNTMPIFQSTELLVLDQHKMNKDWDSVVSFINNDKLESTGRRGKSTVGGVALQYLIDEGIASPAFLRSICCKHAESFIKNFVLTDEHVTLTMICLFHALDDQSETLKEKLVSLHIFPLLIKLFHSKNAQHRTMATHLASKIYDKNTEFQNNFVENSGEMALVALIQSDITDDEVLFDLLDDVKDLVLDSKGNVNAIAMAKIIKMKVFEYLKSMKFEAVTFKQRSDYLIDKRNEILNLEKKAII